MAHGGRKTRSKRGSRTHGYGNAQKHRGAGHRGGRGMAGSAKQRWPKISKYKKDHLGKKGFKRNPGLRKTGKALNVGRLQELLPQLISQGKAQEKSGKVLVDLTSLGYDKLLGAGDIHAKTEVTVNSSSQKAIEKIESQGGSVVLSDSGESLDSVDVDGE